MALTQVQDQAAKGERINKETGELSASGELSVSVEVKVEKVEGSCKNPQLAQVLREQLQELGIHTSPDQRTDHVPLEQREEHLVNVLPLYIQVCEDGGRLEGLNLKGLAALTADTVIYNIHTRLAERHAEGARCEVVRFFQRYDTKETNCEKRDNQGWLLLKSLLLLTADSSDVLSCINPGLPAALVKCLYLLVCLPAQKENSASEETFQELLTKVLIQLCRHPVNVESLVETQELQCLIIGLTSLWDQTSVTWRHQASRVLKAVSAVATTNTIPNLQEKNCVRICIQNLLLISADVSGPLLAEVAVAVFSFIRDTYPLNPALFVEFDTMNGYKALENILQRCEGGVSVDQFQPVEELLALIASLTLLGKTELKVALCVTNPQPPAFKFDPPLTKGSSVKNLPAFNLLQASLLRSQDSLLCCQLLCTLQTIWERDPANFFLLEWTVQSMAQLAACVWCKPVAVQKMFFSMLEMVIFKLNYIPHETLRALLGVLKKSWTGTLAGGVTGIDFGVVALKCFHRMTVHSGMLVEVLSDWGLLELLLSEIRRRAKILRKAGVVSSPQINPQQLPSVEDSERLLTTCMLQLVSTLTLRSIKNTVSVRDLGMVPYIKIFLDEDQYRGPTLNILEQLAEINPEEFMSTAIGALCSSTQQELGLKRDLLKSVLKVLESPNSWDAFRRAGGFTGLLSLVIDMEGALSDPPQGAVWKSLGHKLPLDLLLLTLHILALAVHLHTVNAHHFETGGFYERLSEALLQLGCFHTERPEKEKFDGEEGSFLKTAEDEQSSGKSFHQFVGLAKAPVAPSSASTTQQPTLPVTLRTCLRLLSYLDQFATGTYSPLELHLELEPDEGCEGVYSGSPPVHLGSGLQSVEDTQGISRNTAPSISTVSTESRYSRFTCDHIILHPGAIRVIMTLLPSVFALEDPQLSMEVQFSLANHIQAMVKSEPNRQIVCEGGLVSTLLTHCRSMLMAPNHPLHLPITRILEKLSSQAITHVDFRKFLCLGNPLMCLADKTAMQLPLAKAPVSNGHTTEGDASSGSPVKTLKRTFSLLQSSAIRSPILVHQIISLVSMTSPRTFRPHRVSTSPAFVEFDMSESGYGCLFLPSLSTVKGVTSDSMTTGGIGKDCRGFPPTAGLSFSCWFQINRFSSACDSHPIRLLTVVRHMSRTEQQYICLSISFSAFDGCLVISTEEEAFTYLDMMEPEVCSPTSLPTSLRFRCSSLLVPGQWHHLAVVMAKDVKKSCVATAYFNGKAVGTGKMRYIQPFPGQYVSMDPAAVIDVFGLIGTPALWKEHAALVWRVGPCYLFEEALSPEAVGAMYTQGTAYQGNFLALRSTGSDPDAESLRLVPEERISFGINPAISKLTTVVQIREDYNEVDCRLIAKEMGITSRDQCTPVFLSQNISQHLSGTARTIGAALVGHFGVRTFTPSSASNGLLYVGGPAVVLSLVAMAPDDSSLYAAVKVLLSVLETNSAMQQEMNRINGYELLAFLLKMKRSLVSHRTFQLVLYLSRSVELISGSGCLENTPAFQALLCDLEVWQNTSDNLDLSVLNHFAEILKSSSSDSNKAAAMHSMGLMPKLLFELSNPAVTVQKVKIILCVVTTLLKAHFTPLDIRRLGLFLVYTLPPLSNMDEGSNELSDRDLPQDMPASLIWIRNQLLLSLCEILNSDSLLIEDQQKALFDTLGSDWFLLFLQPHLHHTTLKISLVLLTHFLSSPSQQSSFREGVLPATLIEGMEEPFAVLDNLRAHSWSYECLSTTCPGFDVLQGLLSRHSHLPRVFEALAALMLERKAIYTADGKVPLDDMLQSLIDSQADSPAQQLCVEAATILLELVKVIITKPVTTTKHMSGTDASWETQLPASVMQFLCLLHNIRPRDPLWASPEFLHTLAGVVYPVDVPECEVEPCIASECEDTFRSHPNRKPVCDFLRILLMDSLLNVCANNTAHPLFLLLEFSPDDASLERRQSFQTELLELIMDIIHMIGHEEENNTHLNSHDCKSETPEGQMGLMMENVVLFSQTLQQKLYSGAFLVDSQSLINFFADQIVGALEKGSTQKEKAVSALYSCTNKVLLYLLSQPRHSQDEKEGVTMALKTFMERWDVVMATYNANVNFITCLLHCLLLIRSGSYPEGFGCVAQKAAVKKGSFCARRTGHPACLGNGADITTDDAELVSLAEACWSKVMVERQHTLEETSKIEISASRAAGTGPVRMTDISPLWEEMAQKAWLLYTESHKMKVASSSQKRFDVISSAVRSALGRLDKESATVEEFLSYMESHRQRGHSMFENMRTNHLQLRASEYERVSSKWLLVEAELMRERAVFGPGPGVLLSQDWVQDAAEGPNRTRSRIRRKARRQSKRVLGTLCMGLRTGMSEEDNKRSEGDTEPKILCEVGAEVKEDEEEGGQDCDHLTFFPALNETTAVTESTADPLTPESCSHMQDCHDIRIILQKLQPGEEVKAKMCVVTVSGLRVTEGVLLFGNESLLLCEGFTLSPAGDVCCRKHHPSSVRDSYISTMLSKELSPARCRCWLYEDIKDARFMRFLLEDNAIEVFMKNGLSAFLVFLNKDHVSAYKRLCTVVSALKGRGVAEVIANAKKTPVVEKAALVNWQKGEISNFEYLMHLNTIAGRTYNDLMQYPVFPWVLADYQSETIDLSNPATFRDLSKPMGAQTEKRKQMFIKRYEEVETTEGEGNLSARCHYCTHYSSAISVASFLVRMEPFSHTFLTLQGVFDIPDRMFYSIKKEWESASRDNTGDVRELIPEFFYLSDFLLNSNHIQLGCMEDGTALGDVELPLWAKGDPQEFIRIHREALESEYVSAHLHLWIDLIFGYRQEGPAAVESVNTFHPYFYAKRGWKDAKDPLIKSTILGYISNFGQVPKQLFTKPHPPRIGTKKEGSSSPPHPTPFFFKLDQLKTTKQSYRELPRGPVGQILCLEKEVVVLERNRLLLSPLSGCFFSWGFPDNTCAFGNHATEKTFAVCESLCDWGETLCAACPNPTTIITAGSSTVVCVWDVSVSKDKLTHMQLRQPLYGHTDSVTCLDVSEVHSMIVSGSRDLTCILWDMEELSYVTQLAGHSSSISALAINELTGEIASCAGPQLYLWTMKGQLLTCTDTSCGPQPDVLCVRFTQRQEWDAKNVIVTGCADGNIRIWKTEYTRTQLPGPPEEPVSPGQDGAESDVSGSCQVKGWERHLVLCQELNRSQAVSQRRSKNIPAITALAISRSHATLLAGDAWGRVFTWTWDSV
ncbi:WD repeat- and FYVE domain-containing protein 4 isoform X1 [Pseudochaenichthys georgianus]|uniref:WD repeat- and FYVE domain-containing protein 4 isoform X1 n=1 Tax=Pseudochaenichthys georgianus TaxID=52239 RepID=UPI00146DDB0F|nr:WD repeat- and FYVE domain-containing protein 4 isoform X1 [Pseudochaenichthys georgianus]XP_033955877.1 WD repeat- and FYVE domain-containing protein 4 isoform X1 [Pseudochaenichthys georgianus]XP_033955880.1 WD repeat- and FYVE domain-containing protein 4 isoform X1 [Pseudochaenichthys georgianus]